MVTSGGSGQGPTFGNAGGRGNGGTFPGVVRPAPTIDEPYFNDPAPNRGFMQDRTSIASFMNILIHAEYRPYVVSDGAGGERIVWAHVPDLHFDELPDLSRYAVGGAIRQVPLVEMRLSIDTIVVIVDEVDGGYINEQCLIRVSEKVVAGG